MSNLLDCGLTAFTWLTIGGTVIVLVGLYFEYGSGTLWNWSKTFEVKVETPSERFGGFLVVVGIALELGGTIGVYVFSNKLETAHRREIAQLEKSVAWRQLTGEQEHKIAASLKMFNGQKVNVFTYFGDLLRPA
jgi:hypothetical protein